MGAIKVAVIRALHLGDLLCTIPAIRALRLAGPRSHIVLIGLPWAREFVPRYPHYFDEFMEFPGWPGIAERDLTEGSPEQLAEFHGAIKAAPFDVVLQLQGDGRVMNDFASTVAGRVHAGFVPPGTADIPPFHIPYPETLSEPLRLLAALAPLGVDTPDATLELPVYESDRIEARALLAAGGAAGQPYVVVHPGGRDDRRWPFERFAAVADAVAARGLRVVVTGSAADRPIADALASRTCSPVIDVVGRTGLGALGAIVDGAQAVVTNDTGVSHVAAARETPSVVVFVGSDPARWAPIDRSRHIALGAGLRGGSIPGAVEVIDATLALVGAAA